MNCEMNGRSVGFPLEMGHLKGNPGGRLDVLYPDVTYFEI